MEGRDPSGACGEAIFTEKPRRLCMGMAGKKRYWVYVIQSTRMRVGKRGPLPGIFYVGYTVRLSRRIRQHNGEIVGGARSTRGKGPWVARAAYGPYKSRSSALKAEWALKHKKRGIARTRWTKKDSKWCRGKGAEHPWVTDPGWEPIS